MQHYSLQKECKSFKIIIFFFYIKIGITMQNYAIKKLLYSFIYKFLIWLLLSTKMPQRVSLIIYSFSFSLKFYHTPF